MKIIHSADWHLGQTLYGYDRLDDQAAALRHIGAIIEREQPDAVIAAGDIFDSSQPSAAAQRLLSETLAEWHRLSRATRMVITAGNHDSASRHEVFRTPWTLAGVEAIGIIPPAEDFGAVARKLIVRIDGKGWIIALPFAGRRLIAEAELVAIKAFLGPMPRALEAAGLKEPPVMGTLEKNRIRRKRKKAEMKAKKANSNKTKEISQ